MSSPDKQERKPFPMVNIAIDILKDRGFPAAAENLSYAADQLKEELADAYKLASGKTVHSSDCATSCAPAEVPGPCDCSTPRPPIEPRIAAALHAALRACCAGNTDDDEPVRCQSYEASEQAEPCPRGRCVMAEPEQPSHAAPLTGLAQSLLAAIRAIPPDNVDDIEKAVATMNHTSTAAHFRQRGINQAESAMLEVLAAQPSATDAKDAQAMALVRKLHIQLAKTLRTPVDPFGQWIANRTDKFVSEPTDDVVQAIFECAEKIKAATDDGRKTP